MKKLSLINILIFILLCSVSLHAQQVRSLWLNVVPGINSNWLLNQNAYGNPEFEYATSFGFSGGMGMTYFQKRHYGVNGFILVSQMGQNYSGIQAGGEADRKVKLLYLEVPLQFMKDIRHMQFPTWFSFGPDFMFLLNAQQQYSRIGGRDLPFEEGMSNNNVKSRYKPFDIGMSFSVNRMYNLDYFRKMMLLFSINSTVGLTDINSSAWQTPNMHDVYRGSHNYYVGIKIGMMFKVARLGGAHW